MSRLSDAFRAARDAGTRVLIPYLTSGYPAKDATAGLLRALAAGGAGIIELGVPFSDPIADGPTIQRASEVSLAAGTTLPWTLDVLRDFRKTSSVPVILFGAYNPFLHYGLEKFAADAAAAGADGVLIPDLPADEGEEVQPILEAAGLALIYLVAPTTPPARKAFIAERGRGFLYYVSLKGVTGARADLKLDLEGPLREIRAVTDLPVAVGFGIGTPEQARRVAETADGVVVGSALIDRIGKWTAEGASVESNVTKYIAELCEALRGTAHAAGPGAR